MEDGRKAVLLNRAGNILLYGIPVSFLLFLFLLISLASLYSYVHHSLILPTSSMMIPIAPFLIVFLLLPLLSLLAGYILKSISNRIAFRVIMRSSGKELIVTRGGRTGRVIIEGAEFKVESPNSFLKVGDRVKLNEIREETKRERTYDPESGTYDEEEYTYYIQEGASKPLGKRALHHTYLVHFSEEYEAEKKVKEAMIERTLTLEEKERLEDYRKKLHGAFRIERIGREMRSSRTLGLLFVVLIFGGLIAVSIHYSPYIILVFAELLFILPFAWVILSFLVSAYGRVRAKEFDKKIEKILRRQ